MSDPCLSCPLPARNDHHPRCAYAAQRERQRAHSRALIAAQTWPNGWSGDEAEADAPLATLYFGDGSSQPTLI